VPTGGVAATPVATAATDTSVEQPAAEPQTTTSQGVMLSRPSAQQRVGGDQMLVRSVEMSLTGSSNRQIRRGGRIVVEGGDPAIPLANVPYFTRDLIRLGIVGAAMIVLLILSSLLLLPHFR
jgi:hypothetical protein